MQLYHFTRPSNVEDIQRLGIIRGDVPTTPGGGFNAPWLTDDPEPASQSWIVMTDKNKVRITVNIKNDNKLRKWSSFAKSAGVDGTWYAMLDRAGGGKSESWYIHMGRIPPTWITNIEFL